MTTRSYTELRRLATHLDRFRYLKLGAAVGRETFGFDRWMNQEFYRSSEWRHIRQYVIARDLGNDLGIDGFAIHDRVYVHHMQPLTSADISDATENLLDPEFLISVTHRTHNAIHYGDEKLLPQPLVERRPGDTTLW